MSVPAIKTAIADVLSGVSGVGRVYTRRLLHTDEDVHLDEVTASLSLGRQIAVWSIHHEAGPDEPEGNNLDLTQDTFRLTGYYAWSERTSPVSDARWTTLIEAIRTAFRGQLTLSGNVDQAFPPRLTLNDHVLFKGVLCHRGEFLLDTERLHDVTHT